VTAGPCAKRRVVCRIWTRQGIFTGTNDCDNPQPTCPRAPGEGYEKCKTICRQKGHAEIAALDAALEARANLRQAEVEVFGHYHVCEHCARTLAEHGVNRIIVKVSR
jgi:tRNA(Arg) A34 adenosine deaminase TadA